MCIYRRALKAILLLGFFASASGAENPAKTATLSVDAAQAGAPISKYIYGQFIEHLGRCIYGGIWAEMLEDRKFFFPVGGKESPWKAIGDAGTVVMAEQDAFVGKHTPRLTLAGNAPGGIVPGRDWPGKRQEVRGPHLAGRRAGGRAGERQPGLGRRPGRPRRRIVVEQVAAELCQDAAGIHRRRRHRQRPAGDHRRRQRQASRSARCR